VKTVSKRERVAASIIGIDRSNGKQKKAENCVGTQNGLEKGNRVVHMAHHRDSINEDRFRNLIYVFAFHQSSTLFSWTTWY